MTYPSCGLKCARALESAILQEGPENVSAFIAEPVVGAALGAAPAPPGYFQKIREICDRHEMDYIEKNQLVRNSKEQGERLLQGFEALKDRRPSVGNVRGRGLMCGVEFVSDKAGKRPFPPELKVAERVMDACLERGLIVYPGHGTVDGVAGDHMLIGPPLVITAGPVADILAILSDAIGAVERELPL